MSFRVFFRETSLIHQNVIPHSYPVAGARGVQIQRVAQGDARAAGMATATIARHPHYRSDTGIEAPDNQ